jgi:HK97 family phage prohead protease
MRFYGTITKIDTDQRMVWGYASTEAEDGQGEIVRREALAAALADYMRFANIREMHRNSAVGIATEAELDDKGLYLGAKIVDDDAWAKVVEGVYKGFSIGGKVTARDPADRNVITGVSLTEISVVDRPANPEAVFDCWKAAGDSRVLRAEPDRTEKAADDLISALDHIQRAHDLLCRAGALCPGIGFERAPGKAASGEDLAKSLSEALVPRLDALAARVDAIARTPLPPVTIARAAAGLSKRDDGRDAFVAPDDIVAALARLSDKDRTLALIKAAHANPIRR